jgi:hypothetical protein
MEPGTMSTNYTYGRLSELELFCLPADLQEFIRRYKAPQKELAIAKQIPITEENMRMIDRVARVIPIIRRWRGSSRFLGEIGESPYYARPHAYCQKRGAERVTIYYRERL